MEIASVRIHRIVATAFHGEPPTKEHVVDHIDTNKRNNRPENLRWVTRLENVLRNPITIKRIELACGVGIEEFLSDHSKFRDNFQEPNYRWMCTVSKEEAQMSKEKLLAWAGNDQIPAGGALGEWIYNRKLENQPKEKESEFTSSVTPNAKQKNWKTHSEFPNCPNLLDENALHVYKERLIQGAIFSKNEYGESIVENSEINESYNELLVLTSSEGVKPYALAKVYFTDSYFIHESLGSFFTLIGAQKRCNSALGLEWDGEDSIDDYS